MLDILGEPLALALIGGIGGILLGLAARLGRFCSLGAIEDALYGDDTRRLRMWGIAISVSVFGTFLGWTLGWIDIEATPYLATVWNPVASILGGLVFGYGMALAGNCGFGALARAGGGDIRSFVILLTMGLAAYATLSGPLAPLRQWMFPIAPADGVAPGMAHLLWETAGLHWTVTTLAFVVVLFAVSIRHSGLWAERSMILWSVVVGLAIVSGWIGTTWVAETGFAATRVSSHTFAAPVGETMLYLMTASGRSLSFGIGSVLGVMAGAFLGSLIKGHFRWEACEDPRELRRQILGAVLMGIGAVVAFGCTVGQGLSAFSVLALSAPVTSAAIFLGAALGLKQLITGFMPAE